MSCSNINLSFINLGEAGKRKGGKERTNLQSIGSSPKCIQQLGLGHAETRSWGQNEGLPCGQQEPTHSSLYHLLLGTLIRDAGVSSNIPMVC